MFKYHVNEFITNWSYQYTGRDPHLKPSKLFSINLYFKVLSINRFGINEIFRLLYRTNYVILARPHGYYSIFRSTIGPTHHWSDAANEDYKVIT